MTVTISDIRRAQNRCDDDDVVRVTPIETSRTLDSEVGADVRLKMEHLQRTGSFKTRGAYNKLTKLTESGTDRTDVIAASAGNHAQGVALAATKAGLDSTIVMPKNAPQAKIDATKGYGGTVDLHGKTFRDAMGYAKSIADDDSVFVHAYDDPDIVAGQGTLGLEIIEQVPDVDTVIVPIGGGGLIGGIATAIGERSPETRIIGVQADGAATVPESLEAGAPRTRESVQTIADGIATGGISDLTYQLITEYVDDVITVTDTEIAESVLFLLERTKQMVEGAGAISVAALRSGQLDVEGEVVVPLLCGGNLSMTDLQTVLTHGLTHRDQLVRLRVQIVDQPGEMNRISEAIGDHGANISDVSHERSAKDLDVGDAYLQFRIETSGSDQTERIVESIREMGYDVRTCGEGEY
ncbi:threonine ammonia-lyase [Natrarchaeobius halalkaliphilus]|uniref:threonine ammonia-lyase n=1 Tax=Natrarchaeobius halalkaliphilus TaxID=1679091 RepID=A0A3N6P3Y0_9EURY|nr:threonine ammonia-lyase [Natrarchaeobius halalkaliphilus]RQG90075.1 threonine ammonia-lyase [Natrarchaeobius halalkaliphilus]